MRYEISGGTLPIVTCYLENGETMITERGSMAWMSPNMRMETTSNGGIGKMFGRMMSGESLFLNRYTSQGGQGLITFASSFPGSIKAFEITPDKPMIIQKTGFLAAESSVELSMHFRKKLGSGLFGGEGFIMQRLSGSGTAFAEFDGSVTKYDLQAGQQIIVDTGYLAAMSASCQMDIQPVQGAKNLIFGGEGLFNTVITGPGEVYLQSMPIYAVANTLRPYFPTSTN